jgi:RNAse (barnase) inhibitor barstar
LDVRREFHGFIKECIQKTCPTKDGKFGSWCAFEDEQDKYRNLSTALKLCGYYSERLDAKTEEVSKGAKEPKELASEAKKGFNGISTKERVEVSFQQWMIGSTTRCVHYLVPVTTPFP